MGKSVLKAKFRIASQDPNKFRLEQERSVEIDGVPNGIPFGPMVMIGDGTDVWGISPALNQYTKLRPSDLPTIQAWVKAAKSTVFDPPMTLGKTVTNSTLLREESLELDGNSVDCFVIKTTIPCGPESTTFWLEKMHFLIRRVRSEIKPTIATRGLGLLTTSEFLVVNMGVALPDSTFVFTPSPSATEVNKIKP